MCNNNIPIKNISLLILAFLCIGLIITGAGLENIYILVIGIIIGIIGIIICVCVDEDPMPDDQPVIRTETVIDVEPMSDSDSYGDNIQDHMFKQ